MFGIEEFDAVINPPESAILAVGTVTREAVVDDDGSILLVEIGPAFLSRRKLAVRLTGRNVI